MSKGQVQPRTELGVPSTIDVLLIEDDPLDAEFIRRVLTIADLPSFTLTVSESLRDAFDRLGNQFNDDKNGETVNQSYDVVLLDLGLPDTIGLDAVEELRSFDARVPIVVLTGLENERTAMKAIENGAQDFLSKINLSGLTLIRSLRFSIARHLKFLGIQAAADLDPLTNISNRRGLEPQFNRLWELSHGENESMSIALIDLDHFKEINDLHGHFFGDVVLRDFATRLPLNN